MLLRDVALRRAILVDVAPAAVGRLDHEPDMAVLATGSTGAAATRTNLFSPSARRVIGLAVGDLRVADAGLHAELAAQAVDDDLQVELAHPADDDLARVGVGVDAERRVLDREPLERGDELV